MKLHGFVLLVALRRIKGNRQIVFSPNTPAHQWRPRARAGLLVLLAYIAITVPAMAQVTILSENFEGAFPGQWSVGVSVPGGSTATWEVVNSNFGGVGTHAGQGKGFCAGTQPNYTCGVADFRNATIHLDGDITTALDVLHDPNGLSYRSNGPAWAITYSNGVPFMVNFTPNSSGQHSLTVTHLTSAASCTGGGSSPVTIANKGTNLAICYDPAAYHGGDHSFVTDSWTFNATVGARVTNTWSLCASACSQYWIQQATISGSGPGYQSDMTAFMQRSINLTGCTNATLTFWHIMPSLDAGYDYGRVLIDGNEIWRKSNSVGTWTQVQINLNSYTGAWHVLRFEFDSDYYLWGRGWYLDDILLTTSFRSATQTNAPMVFAASDFPNQIGEYYRAYRSTNAMVSSWVSQSGAAQRWDFSQSQQSVEFIQRMDIVTSGDGPSGEFPAATYAERYTRESNGQQSWSYYSLTNTVGRYYHGFTNRVDHPILPLIVFVPPFLQFPVPVHFGQAWSWDTALVTQYGSLIEYAYLTNSVSVDGYGKFVLLGGREVPSLRVKEIQFQRIVIFDTNALITISTNFYWLVRGVGLAAQISVFESSLAATQDLATAQSLRVFEAGDFKDLLLPVQNLRLQLQDSEPSLSWNSMTGNGYRVEFTLELPASNWELRNLTSTNFWSDTSSAPTPQGFYRVFARP